MESRKIISIISETIFLGVYRKREIVRLSDRGERERKKERYKRDA
jgi:hypothetical protein